MQLCSLHVFFLDIQSTGANPRNGRMLELAWGTQASDIESQVLQQTTPVPRQIQRLTGIGPKEMECGQHPDALKQKFTAWLAMQSEDTHAVIHYAPFERAFLEDWLGPNPFPILCTNQIARKLYPNLPTRSLRGLAGFCGHGAPEEFKRARSHVEATLCIWKFLVEDLAKLGVSTLEDLQSWLKATKAPRRQKYEYAVPREKRLSLSQNPGVYRMLNRAGQVLYVGKATSLHARVNSYFRGQKNRDPLKLEMLTQVCDIEVTECRSPLEAALLETDEIKRLCPPYNISLKEGDRTLIFFSKAFDDFEFTQSAQHPIGPFTHPLVFDSMVKLLNSLTIGQFHERLFWDPIDANLLAQAFARFSQEHSFEGARIKNLRSLLTFGFQLWRKARNHVTIEKTLNPDEKIEDDPLAEAALVAKFHRHFVRAAQTYYRTRRLSRLLNARIRYGQTGETNETYELVFKNGKRDEISAGIRCAYPWSKLGVKDYDRMSVLSAELKKIKKFQRLLS